MSVVSLTTDISGPLRYFYSIKGAPMPDIEIIEGRKLPQPSRYLLVHDSDMTSRLQGFFGQDLYIEVLHKEQRGFTKGREVVLRLNGDHRAVEYGAIHIDYSLLPGDAQREIVEGKRPLGAILNGYGVEYSSNPSHFFRVLSDDVMARAFSLNETAPLYGRCNMLLYPNGRVLADVVEILPPNHDLLELVKP